MSNGLKPPNRINIRTDPVLRCMWSTCLICKHQVQREPKQKIKFNRVQYWARWIRDLWTRSSIICQTCSRSVHSKHQTEYGIKVEWPSPYPIIPSLRIPEMNKLFKIFSTNFKCNLLKTHRKFRNKFCFAFLKVRIHHSPGCKSFRSFSCCHWRTLWLNLHKTMCWLQIEGSIDTFGVSADSLASAPPCAVPGYCCPGSLPCISPLSEANSRREPPRVHGRVSDSIKMSIQFDLGKANGNHHHHDQLPSS